QRAPLSEEPAQRAEVAQLRLQESALEELVDAHLYGVDLVADVLEMMERGSGERGLQPSRRGEPAAGRQRGEIRVELHELRPVRVRGGGNGESPRLLLQHGRMVAERALHPPVVRIALAAGPPRAAGP